MGRGGGEEGRMLSPSDFCYGLPIAIDITWNGYSNGQQY